MKKMLGDLSTDLFLCNHLCACVQVDHVSASLHHVLHMDNKLPIYMFSDFTLLASPYTEGINNCKLHFKERRTACALVGIHMSEDLNEKSYSSWLRSFAVDTENMLFKWVVVQLIY